MDIIFGLGMALPIVSTTAVSVVTGVAQGVSEQKKVNADASNQTRMLKFHVDVLVDPKFHSRVQRDGSQSRTRASSELHNGILTLRNDKVWIDVKSPITRQPENIDHHPFTGFYIAYPDDNRGYTRGLVSTISRDPPVLNWIYVDKDTFEVKYASRSGSIMHHVGDFDWTTEENEGSCITLDGWEGFLAVEEDGGKGWALYFDWDDDGLKQKKKGRKAVEIHLQRRVITGQEVNKWGLKEEGNIGFRATREI